MPKIGEDCQCVAAGLTTSLAPDGVTYLGREPAGHENLTGARSTRDENHSNSAINDVCTSRPLDIIPGIGLLTKVALLNARVHLAGDRLRHHLEMPHIVARRRLVTLRAFLGAR